MLNIELISSNGPDGKPKKHCPFMPPTVVPQASAVNPTQMSTLAIVPVPCMEGACKLYDTRNGDCRAAFQPIHRPV